MQRCSSGISVRVGIIWKFYGLQMVSKAFGSAEEYSKGLGMYLYVSETFGCIRLVLVFCGTEKVQHSKLSFYFGFKHTRNDLAYALTERNYPVIKLCVIIIFGVKHFISKFYP